MATTAKCRLCTKERKFCLNSLRENEIATMLQGLTGMKVAYSDKIPYLICPTCHADLKVAYNIQQKIIKVETKYHNEMVTDFLKENNDELIKVILQKQEQVEGQESAVENSASISPVMQTTSVKHECHICSFKFQHSPDYVKHLQEHIWENESPRTETLCEHCGDIFFSLNQYKSHIKEKHTDNYECHYCCEMFATSMYLDEHVKELHMDKKPFLCTICNEKFAIKYIMNLHKKQHFIVKPYGCELCEQRFKQRMSLRYHMITNHKDQESEVAKPENTKQ